MASSMVTSFLSALQASVSVLLTISYGVFANQIGFIDEANARNVSNLCVRMFLPALLLTNIGSQLNLDSAYRYLPVIVWGLAYNILSLGLCLGLQRLFRLPTWTTPACVFNNTTAFPLLLVQSLATTSVFQLLLWHDDDTTNDALDRAVSYFLVNSMISNSITFGLGPMLLERDEEEAEGNKAKNGHSASDVARTRSDPSASSADVERALQDEREAEIAEIAADEETSLLPHRVNVLRVETSHESYKAGVAVWDKMPSRMQWILAGIGSFISAPLVGATLGVIIGLAPPLQQVFFASAEDGGYFNAWLTVSLQNIGKLFPALQVVVVGIKLAKSLRALKHNEESGNLPWGAVSTVVLARFVVFPALSIGIIFAVAANTSILPREPVLWFTMMIMHTGPPALELVAMADVNGADEREKMSISKLITICYLVSPIASVAIISALKALKSAQ